MKCRGWLDEGPMGHEEGKNIADTSLQSICWGEGREGMREGLARGKRLSKKPHNFVTDGRRCYTPIFRSQ